MIHDDDTTSSTNKPQPIIPGEDLSAFSLDDLAERRLALLDEIQRIDEITDKKRAGRDAADAVFKV
jgi:uncharacterized small protein (DUF1192 family)